MANKAHVVGSGNVFADLGHPRPAEALAKAELARKIGGIIERRGLTQAAAAEILEVDQPKVSALIRGGWRASRWTVWCGSWCCWEVTSKSW